MPFDTLLAFIGYAFVTSITPGPNNTMLLASGVNFGLRRSLPHALGINLGFGAMLAAIGLGLGAIFIQIPQLFDLLRVVGIAYLLYLAWLIARDDPMSAQTTVMRAPMSFLGAAAFQWVNPKAWIMVMGAITTYVPADGRWQSIAIVTVVYVLVNAPCILAWAGFGVVLRGYLGRPGSVRWFNYAMALILCLSVYPNIAALWRGNF